MPRVGERWSCRCLCLEAIARTDQRHNAESEYVDVRGGLMVAMLGRIAMTGVATRRPCTRR
jgi:hypothetical protein